MKFTLPIHYTFKYKSKKDKTVLVGLNAYRNWHFLISNKIKHHYHELVAAQIKGEKFDKVRLHYKVYAARNGTDGHNIRAVIEKFFMDGLVGCGVIEDDDISHVLGDTSEYFIDKENPRIEIEIIPQP